MIISGQSNVVFEGFGRHVMQPIVSNPFFAETLAATQLSAESSESEVSNAQAEAIKSDFREWKQEYFDTGISGERRAQVKEYSEAFEQLVDQAVQSGAYDDPKGFLQSLSGAELEVLQHMHNLAAPVDPDGLSEEGALNLLLSPGHPQDIDHDGFQMIGLAKGWTFPPVNAPESVQQAWGAATANMSEKETILLQGSFLPFAIDMETGDSVSAYISPHADYADLVQQALDGAEFSKAYDKSWQHETRAQQIAGLESLLQHLTA